jgi:hypothetical protein
VNRCVELSLCSQFQLWCVLENWGWCIFRALVVVICHHPSLIFLRFYSATVVYLLRVVILMFWRDVAPGQSSIKKQTAVKNWLNSVELIYIYVQ